MDWIRLTPAGEEDGDLFTAYNYTDHCHNLNEAYQPDDETPIYILDDVGIALSDAEFAAIPPVKALVEAARSDGGTTTVSASLRELVTQLARQGGWGAWTDWLQKRADLLDAALAPFKAAE